MNGSAPATLRVPVPRWERLAAGVVAAGMAAWHPWWPDVGPGWWRGMQIALSSIMEIWQGALRDGTAAKFVQPVSAEFAVGVYWSCSLGFLVGIVWLAGAGLWIAVGRGGRRMRSVFWLSLPGVGLSWFGMIGALGRQLWLDGFRPSGSDIASTPWHGGWLEFLRGSKELYSPDYAIICSLLTLLGLLMLGLGGWQRRRGSAEGRAA